MTVDARHQLDNPNWYGLTGPNTAFAEGTGLARRFRPEISVFGAFEHDTEAAWADLAQLVGSGGGIVLNRAADIAPKAGWTSLGVGTGDQMVLDGEPRADEAPGTRPLTDDDVDEMIALVTLTEPGPFRPRTIELGGYAGIVVDHRILAMAGRRTATDHYVEVSAVCTHPDGRRRGYAAAITATVARGIIAEGKTPILHVAHSNPNAKAVYDKLGFAVHQQMTFGAFRAPSVAT